VRRGAIAVVLLAALAGCTGAGAPDPAGQQARATVPSDGLPSVGTAAEFGSESPTPSPSPSSTEFNQFSGPLEELMAVAYGTNLSDEDRIRQLQDLDNETQDVIAQCMKDQGFDYRPNPSHYGLRELRSRDYRPDDLDWVQENGYGIFNSPLHDPSPNTSGGSGHDPNFAIRSSMSEAEGDAYDLTLYGPNNGIPVDEPSDPADFVPPTWQTAGCQRWANFVVWQKYPAMSREFRPLMEVVSGFELHWADTGVISALDADWSSCMALAGYPDFAHQADAPQWISETYYSEIPSTLTWEERLDLYPRFREARDVEIALALADLDCREQSNYRTEYSRLRIEAEEQFIADHKAEFDAFVLAAEQAQASH
jgi:hypothetical protein